MGEWPALTIDPLAEMATQLITDKLAAGRVTVRGTFIAGVSPEQVTIETESDQYRVIDGATDYFADTVIELSADWSNTNITTHAAIATYDAQGGPGAPYVFLAGPHAGTEIADAARIALGIQDAGNEDAIAFLAAKKVEIAGNDFGASILVGGDPNDTSGAADDVVKVLLNSSEVMRLVDGATSGQTAMWLAYHDGTSVQIKQVTLGAADSGGSGFKVLRVPN